ncbi:MAG: hypothetical protein ACP5GB_00885 [Candidatus Micrarchaeia archaeon]
MDLLAKSAVAVVAIVVLLALVYYIVVNFGSAPHISEQEAISFVVSDIKNHSPTAVINITSVYPSQYPGSWHIVMSVIYNSTSPCPDFYSYSFDYPKYGFVYRVENNYTSSCVVHGLSNNPNFIIAAAPIAIVRVYSFPAAQAYISKFGFSNVSTSAAFYTNASIMGKNYTNVWKVVYSSQKANQSEIFYISQIGGNLIANYSLPS